MPQRPEQQIADFQHGQQLQQKPSPCSPLWAVRYPRNCNSSNASPTSRTEPEAVTANPPQSRPTSPEPVPPKSWLPDVERKDSELREELCELRNCLHDTGIASKPRQKRAASALPDSRPKTATRGGSFPDLRTLNSSKRSTVGNTRESDERHIGIRESTERRQGGLNPSGSSTHTRSIPDTEHMIPELESLSDALDDEACQDELEAKWVISLSMHFRDGSEREKFFVTYIQHPNRWLRVTVSCDYRSAPDDSLESDLKSLHYQRDKNARIYKAIRDSLPDIQFYDTVTNLKLETRDKRLHVHVKEDVNEIIKYPPTAAIQHLDFERHGYLQVRESDCYFESHLSGFVYRVSIGTNIYIKKEISSPDTVDEFLYELNALATLQHSRGVIRLVGVIVDDFYTCIKGLIIEWASGGPLNDFLFENHNRVVPWPRRVKWAKQIVAGIADIHEAGFIQGDCTISNIVLDANDDAKIVDINRRGCPIGWEPPEFEGMIRNAQRISLYIGVKSDLFQLGMILWAIAKQADEPEREERPLRLDDIDPPQFYRAIVQSCLSEDPVDRMSAKHLLNQFPLVDSEVSHGKLNLNGHSVIGGDDPTSQLSAARIGYSGDHKLLYPNHDWDEMTENLGSHSFSKGQPNYELQDNLLAGIGPFEDKNSSMKFSETPTNQSPRFQDHIHHDSGLDFALPEYNLLDRQSKDGDGQPRREDRAYGSTGVTGESDTVSRLPVHQDSGFDESAFLEVDSTDTKRVMSTESAQDIPSSLDLTASFDPNTGTVDLLSDITGTTDTK